VNGTIHETRGVLKQERTIHDGKGADDRKKQTKTDQGSHHSDDKVTSKSASLEAASKISRHFFGCTHWSPVRGLNFQIKMEKGRGGRGSIARGRLVRQWTRLDGSQRPLFTVW
jgi:hypothetical protein